MKKYLINIVGVLLVLVCMLTSCKPMEVNEVKTNEFDSLVAELKEKRPSRVPSHIVLDGTDSFCIDAEIHISEELDSYLLGNLTMYRHVFRDEEKEAIMQSFIEAFSWEEDLLKKASYRVKDEMFENGELETALNLFVNDYESIIVQSRGIFVRNGSLGERYRGWGISVGNEIQEDPDYYKLLTVTNEELEFASIEKVNSEVDTLMQKIGIEFQCASKVYSFPLNQLEIRVASDKKFYEDIGLIYDPEQANISKQDEAYNVILLQGANGVPLFPHEMSSNVTNSTFVGSLNSVLYSEKGIEDISLRNIYDIETEGEKQDILSLGDVLEIYYTERAKETVAKEKIIKIGLYYLPVCVDEEQLKFEAKPIWYILSDVEYGTLDNTFREWTVYDAVTGEELAC